MNWQSDFCTKARGCSEGFLRFSGVAWFEADESQRPDFVECLLGLTTTYGYASGWDVPSPRIQRGRVEEFRDSAESAHVTIGVNVNVGVSIPTLVPDVAWKFSISTHFDPGESVCQALEIFTQTCEELLPLQACGRFGSQEAPFTTVLGPRLAGIGTYYPADVYKKFLVSDDAALSWLGEDLSERAELAAPGFLQDQSAAVQARVTRALQPSVSDIEHYIPRPP